MQPEMQKSILQMARGAIMERADYEMSRLLANILDPNTSATAKRKLTLTLELKPDDDRQTITVSLLCKCRLLNQQSRPLRTWPSAPARPSLPAATWRPAPRRLGRCAPRPPSSSGTPPARR